MKVQIKKGLGAVRIDGKLHQEGETFEVSEKTFKSIEEDGIVEPIEPVENKDEEGGNKETEENGEDTPTLEANDETPENKGNEDITDQEENEDGEVVETTPEENVETPKVEDENAQSDEVEDEEIDEEAPASLPGEENEDVPAPEAPKDPDVEAEEAQEGQDGEIVVDMDEVMKMTRDDVYKFARNLEKTLNTDLGIKKNSTKEEIQVAIQKIVDEA